LTRSGLRGHSFQSQVAIPTLYKGAQVGNYYADLIVESQVIVELKSVSDLHNVHLAQALTYLKITNLRLALLINFDVPVLHRGVKRVIR
jgi:GxxExxY protein